MKLLALDTSSEACSTALLDGDEVIYRHQLAPRKHADLVLPMLDELLAEAEIKLSGLDAIAFGRGPGAFTGVRIAAAVTQGIAFSADKPVVPVSTLAAMAQQVMDEENKSHVLTALDARMGEVYWAAWQKNKNGYAENIINECVVRPDLLGSDSNYFMNEHSLKLDGNITNNSSLTPINKWTGAGNGWEIFKETLAEKFTGRLDEVHPDVTPHAVSIARLGEWYFNNKLIVTAENALPVYLRDKVAKKKS